MFSKSAVLFIHAESSLHAGSGVSIGVVDLPIQRETHTNFPMIQAPGVKGAIRWLARDLSGAPGFPEALTPGEINTIFGPDLRDGDENRAAGAIAFTDARILLFPVRSLQGLFSWVTCSYVIHRFIRDLRALRISDSDPSTAMDQVEGLSFPRMLDRGKALVTENSRLLVTDDRMVLEDYTFDVSESGDATVLSGWLAQHIFPDEAHWQQALLHGLAVVSDDDFKSFTETSVEILTRIKIGDLGVVGGGGGGLWQEENLPSHTVMYSLVMGQRPRLPGRDSGNAGKISDAEGVMSRFEGGVIGPSRRAVVQMGGNETVGRGFVSLQYCQKSDLKYYSPSLDPSSSNGGNGNESGR